MSSGYEESFVKPPEDSHEAGSSSLSHLEVWEMIKEIGLMERHFHQMQNHYRLLASTWILAVFAATGFILNSNGRLLDSLLSKELAIALLAFFGGIGITLLWTMDLKVYGMLLRGVFNEGKDLEKEYGWLPKIRTGHIKGHFPKGDVQYVTWFYIGANAVVLSLGGVFLSMMSYRLGGMAYLSLTILCTWTFILAWCYLLFSKTPLRRRPSGGHH